VTDSRSVLFVRLSAMGDLVQGLGAITALHRLQPRWRLVVATQTTFAPLLDGVEGVADVVAFERRGGVSALWRLRRALRRFRFDAALDLQGNWKSALVTRLSGARARLGMAARWRQEPASRMLLQRTIDNDAVPHPARAAWELVRALAPTAPFLRPRLVATPAEMSAERAALVAAGVDPSRPFTVVVVTDPADPRALSSAMVDAACATKQRPSVRLLGPAEEHLAPRVGESFLRHGRGEVRRLIALGAVVREVGGDVLGPDQGASHVLAAAGATCRVVFGAQAPARTAPVGVVALVHPRPPACSPCRLDRCAHPEGPVCMAFPLTEARTSEIGLPPSSPT